MRRVTRATNSRPAKRLLLKRRVNKHLPRHRARWIAGLVLAACVAVGVAAMVDSSSRLAAVRQAILGATGRLGLAVETVDVTGRHMTAKSDILAALDANVGMPILGLSLDTARHRLEALPWVRTAMVERHLPGHIVVELTERQPLAQWQRGGKTVLIDTEGVVVLTDHLEPYVSLLKVVGEDAPKHAQELIDTLNTQPELAKRVTSAYRVEERRWTVCLDNGSVEVKLPETDMASAWARLAEDDRRHAVLLRDVKMVDLRFDDRVVVMPASLPPKPVPSKPAKPADKTT